MQAPVNIKEQEVKEGMMEVTVYAPGGIEGLDRGIKVDNGRCRRLRWRHL